MITANLFRRQQIFIRQPSCKPSQRRREQTAKAFGSKVNSPPPLFQGNRLEAIFLDNNVIIGCSDTLPDTILLLQLGYPRHHLLPQL
jgi:hypothetical protein